MPRKDLLIITGIFLLACAVYFAGCLSVTYPGFPLDDSWIHQVFARNLATGHGFSFAPDKPFPGATAPLWTLLLAPIWMILGPVASGLILGVILELLAIFAIYKLAELLTGDRGIAMLSAMISATTWVLVWGALSGMEVGLYSALSLWGLYFYFKAGAFDDRRYYLAYALLALAFLSRPECALILAAVFLRDAVTWFRSPDKRLLPWAWRILPVALLLAPYLVFNYSAIGSLFPQTFAAKERGRGLISGIAIGDLKRIVNSLSILPYYYVQDFMRSVFTLNPILLVSFLAGAAKFVSMKDELSSKRIMLVILLLLYTPLMGTMAPVLTPTFHRMRTIGNIVPLFVMVGVAGLFWREAKLGNAFRKPLLIVALLLAVFGIVLILADGFVIDIFGPLLLHDVSRARDVVQRDLLTSYVEESGRSGLFMALILLAGLAVCTRWKQEKLAGTKTAVVTAVLILIFTGWTFISNAGTYANDVKNINEMDVEVGRYLNEIAKDGQTVAVNDIGAIGYFSGMEIFDLKGLVSPEITAPMILKDSLAFEYMWESKRVDYLAIFPVWFDYIPKRTDVFEPIKRFGVEWNTILAGDTTYVYRAAWPSLTAETGDSLD